MAYGLHRAASDIILADAASARCTNLLSLLIFPGRRPDDRGTGGAKPGGSVANDGTRRPSCAERREPRTRPAPAPRRTTTARAGRRSGRPESALPGTPARRAP